MSASFSTMVAGIAGISLLHAIVPHHWLPYVIVGRRQGWQTRKIITLLSVGALVHTLSTLAVGLAIGYLGHEIGQRLEAFHGIIPGLILVAFGSGFFLSNSKHFHGEFNEKVAASSLIFMLGLSPCLVVAPVFIILGPLGLANVVKISLVMSMVSILGMTFFGWLAIKGLNSVKLEWLEQHESRVMGTLLMILGVTFILI